MKKYSLYIITIPLAIVGFASVLWWNGEKVEKQDLKTDDIVTYEFATDINNQNIKGGKVKWLGVISDRNQLQGIKFWILDEQHPANAWNYYEWFWATPVYSDSDDSFGIDGDVAQGFGGNWVKYMMKKYGNIEEDGIDWSGIYRITGSFDGGNCEYYDKVDMHTVCIPSVTVESIEHVGTLPSFEKYLVQEVFTGSSAPLNLRSHPIGLEYRTVLRDAYTGESNFAGHYTVALYGCGSPCQRFVIIDNQTGELYQTDEFQSAVGIDFKKESNLLIVNPPSTLSLYRDANEKENRSMATWEQFPSYYYKWENNQLTPLNELIKNQ